MALCSPLSLNARRCLEDAEDGQQPRPSQVRRLIPVEDGVQDGWTTNSAVHPDAGGIQQSASTAELSNISSSVSPRRKQMRRRNKPNGAVSQATSWPVSPPHPKGFFRCSRWIHRVTNTDGEELHVPCVPESRPLSRDFWSDVVPTAPSVGPSSLQASWASLPPDELRDHLYRLREEMEEFAPDCNGISSLGSPRGNHIDGALRGKPCSMGISGCQQPLLARKPKAQRLAPLAEDPDKQPWPIKFAARLSAIRAGCKLNGATASEKLNASTFARRSLAGQSWNLPPGRASEESDHKVEPPPAKPKRRGSKSRSGSKGSRKSTTAGSSRSEALSSTA